MTRPFLRWAGGKSQLLPELTKRLPDQWGRYFEPFLGGGALFLHLGHLSGPATLSDANGALISTWRNPRARRVEVADELKRCIAMPYSELRDEFRLLSQPNPELRDSWSVRYAALFIALNLQCYNGLYRVNRRGEFNVPADPERLGRLPSAAWSENLAQVARLITHRDLVITHGDFEAILAGAQPGDFTYLDPPYWPRTQTASFSTYTPGGFSSDDHKRLAGVCRDLDRRGVRWMLSQADLPPVRELFAGFRIEAVTARRSINSKGSKRGPVGEIIVRNYVRPSEAP